MLRHKNQHLCSVRIQATRVLRPSDSLLQSGENFGRQSHFFQFIGSGESTTKPRQWIANKSVEEVGENRKKSAACWSAIRHDLIRLYICCDTLYTITICFSLCNDKFDSYKFQNTAMIMVTNFIVQCILDESNDAETPTVFLSIFNLQHSIHYVKINLENESIYSLEKQWSFCLLKISMCLDVVGKTSTLFRTRNRIFMHPINCDRASQ